MNMVRCGKFVPEAFFSFSIYFNIKITKTFITYYLTVTLLNNQDNWLGDSPLSTVYSLASRCWTRDCPGHVLLCC